MVDTNNQESRKYNFTDNEDMNNTYWINGLLAWWSGFSLRTKLLAIATLVVSLLMTGITFFIPVIRRLTTRVAIANNFVLKLKPLHQARSPLIQ